MRDRLIERPAEIGRELRALMERTVSRWRGIGSWCSRCWPSSASASLYGAYVRAVDVPAASGLLGHSLGVVGFTMMLMTETLYSLRKRAMRRPRGTMRSWLRFHIFTGIVGPYLVVLHAAWTFNGLAGALTAMTVVVVASGFIGRYIYTAVPRTADGVVIEAQELQLLLEAARQEVAHPSPRTAASPGADTGPGAGGVAPAARARTADGGAPLGAAHAGDLARDPHPPRDGALRDGRRPHRWLPSTTRRCCAEATRCAVRWAA